MAQLADLRTMLAGVATGLVLLDAADLRVRALNDAFADFLDPSLRDVPLIGLRADDALPGARQEGMIELLHRAAETDTVQRAVGARYPFLSGGGARWDIEVTPIPAGDGHPRTLLLSVETAAMSGETEEAGGPLAKELDEMRLFSDALIGMVRSKNQFIAAMGHRLRSPLTALVGFSEMLDAGEVPDADRQMVYRDLVTAGRQLLDMVQDVLEFARLESGDLRLNVGPMDLAATVKEAQYHLEPLAAVRRQRLFTELPPDLPHALADRRWIAQVIIKLGTNALRYSPTLGTVKLRARVGEAGFVTVEISDSGIGIRQEEQEGLFQPFGDAVRGERSEGGTGLDLALVKRLVELQQGSLRFTSVAGVGTTFIVSLPPAR